MSSIKEKLWLQVFIIYTRYMIGGAFVFASLIKIKGKRFTSISGASEPIDTAWHFFETMYQSGLYWKFIGIGQLIAGGLLMTQRYAKLGALLNLPIIANVFIITLSYCFAYTPVITGLMLFANMLLIIWDWNALKVIINLPPIFDKKKRFEKDKIWEITGIALFLFTFIYRLLVDGYDPFFWAGVCFLVGITGLIIGLKRRRMYYPKENTLQ
ncbi:hypothetical protein [Aquimarina megaterium]|uniref:hypothetical protein n=1 Tax=Aquimarina megaterium TaxID=1443666 RepID=UPI0004B75805|nr:hypothetical protein [Aquimarina megaterium]